MTGRKTKPTVFMERGFHIFENNGTIQMEELPDISSDQEEADTKMFLYAKYCVLLGGSSVCIHTIDTDYLYCHFTILHIKITTS